MADTSEVSIEEQRQNFEPEYPQGKDQKFPGSELEQKQNQRSVEQNKKHKEHYNQEYRQAGLQDERSRSRSRRDRRRRVKDAQTDGKYMHTNSLPALEEADANGELHEMQPFERIGPDSTSMDGPVTKARADRGEIPVRGSNPNQPYYKTPPEKEKGKLQDTDGLKLSLEANLEIEIELKASIRGDLTISLFE